MSVRVMGEVFYMEMEPNEKLVLLCYADHADDDGHSVFPSIAKIAKKSNYCERQVQIITRALEKKGFLLPDGSGPHGTNKWIISMGGAKTAPVNPSAPTGEPECTPGVNRGAPEPSINHQLTISTRARKKDILDGILEAEAKAGGKGYLILPEQYHDYAKVCCEVANLPWSKKNSFDWMDTFNEWMEYGAQPSDVIEAIKGIRKDGRIGITRPGTITHRIIANLSLRRSGGSQTSAQRIAETAKKLEGG
jgi:hypothetical protein